MKRLRWFFFEMPDQIEEATYQWVINWKIWKR
jgi:hypothetical protein